MPRRKLSVFRIPGAPWWSPHEEVMARDVTEADMAWVQDQVNSVKPETAKPGQQQTATVQVLAGQARILLLVRCIVSWTLTDEDRHGNPVQLPMPPYSDDPRVLEMRKQSIGTLAPEDSSYIYDMINTRSQPMTEAQQEDFLQSVIDGSSANHQLSSLPSLSEK